MVYGEYPLGVLSDSINIQSLAQLTLHFNQLHGGEGGQSVRGYFPFFIRFFFLHQHQKKKRNVKEYQGT